MTSNTTDCLACCFLFFSFLFWLSRKACRILVPQPGMEPEPPALGAGVLTTGLWFWTLHKWNVHIVLCLASFTQYYSMYITVVHFHCHMILACLKITTHFPILLFPLWANDFYLLTQVQFVGMCCGVPNGHCWVTELGFSRCYQTCFSFNSHKWLVWLFHRFTNIWPC